MVARELKVVPSTRVSWMELCSEDDENLVLRNNEKIEWLAGGVLENLFYRLYDEAGREVPLTAEIASSIKVLILYIVFPLCLLIRTLLCRCWFCKCQLCFFSSGKIPVVWVCGD